MDKDQDKDENKITIIDFADHQPPIKEDKVDLTAFVIIFLLVCVAGYFLITAK